MTQIVQFTIQAENKAGMLAQAIRGLAYGGVNIRSIMAFEQANQGVVRLVVHDPVKAERILREQGISFEKEEILVLRLPDKPGQLHRVASLLSEHQINIEYVYPALSTSAGATICLKTAEPTKTMELLKKHHIQLVQSEDV